MNNRICYLCRFFMHYIQLIFAWFILHTLKTELLKMDIWLICEKRDEARDNGFHLYKYLKVQHPDVNAFYVIRFNSPDYHKVKQYGNLIEADSWKHCLYFLAAKYSISSQPYGAYPFHFSAKMMNYVQMLCNREQKVIFLQHGIIYNKLSENVFSYNLCNIDYFVTSTRDEYEFVKKIYKYPDHAIGCIGMTRFDNLHTEHFVYNQILVMPTWRRWLDSNKTNFVNSEYYKTYFEMLQDQSLIQYLRSSRYKLIFYMHYKLQPYTYLFRALENDVVIIADKINYDVQELLMSSKLLITDFSSIHFDFAYMNKPVVYYQFDKEKFFNFHYAEGYFSHINDGFGPCIKGFEQLKKYIYDTIKNNCVQPAKYDLRVKKFFTVRDMNNCKRTYLAIKSLN